MRDFSNSDLFTDLDLVPDPHPYFEHLRSKGPVVHLPKHNVMAVTGYEEGFAVLRDHETFSSIVTAKGPFPPLPFTPQGEDITEQLEQHRDGMPYGTMLVAMDPPNHTRTRMLLMGLLTQKRFRENEEFMSGLADRLIDTFIDRGLIEVISDYSHPFATLAIADLMGMPEEAHQKVLPLLGTLPGRIGGDEDMSSNPLAQVGMLFYEYIDDRRKNPRADVMSILANAKYQDGELPDLVTITSLAALLFGAGQDTTVRLIAAMMKTFGENPELQEQVRTHRDLVPNFIEEVLRLDGPTKAVFRLAKGRTKIGDVEVAPGGIVMLVLSSMNRDPRHFEDPATFIVDRKNARENVSFGRGVHACIGAPLARVEAALTINKLLDRIRDIRIDEAKHGPAGARRYEYEPNYTQRALCNIHVKFSKV